MSKTRKKQEERKDADICPLQLKTYAKGKLKLFLVVMNLSAIYTDIDSPSVSMGWTVNRQMTKNLMVNREKTQFFYCQPSNEQANISRQMSPIATAHL